MSWNDGYERKKFEKKQAAQAERYRLLGMNEAQIHQYICLIWKSTGAIASLPPMSNQLKGRSGMEKKVGICFIRSILRQ